MMMLNVGAEPARHHYPSAVAQATRGAAVASEVASLVDAHVHFYDCFDEQAFFDGANDNFEAAALQLGLPRDTPGFLLFTERSREHYFRQLRDRGPRRTLERWSFDRPAESYAVTASRDGVNRFTIVAGRQIVTRERLEVLALGVEDEFADGRPIQDVLSDVTERGAVAVVPWGFGKWWSARGAIVDQLVGAADTFDLCFGDIGGRLRWLPTPAQFHRAQLARIPILPGSDPLPFASQTRRAASYGVAVRSQLDELSPTRSLLNAIRRRGFDGPRFGRREGLATFVFYQSAIQLRRRLGRS